MSNQHPRCSLSWPERFRTGGVCTRDRAPTVARRLTPRLLVRPKKGVVPNSGEVGIDVELSEHGRALLLRLSEEADGALGVS